MSVSSICARPSRTLGLLLVGVVLLMGTGCTGESEHLFARLDPEQTGVDFENTIATDDSLMNPLDYFYVHNGGGVAAGDLNGNGRTDLYFAGNTVRNRLYLNQGNFEFRNVTETAGVGAEGAWSTGLTLVDVNQDGRMDIYVSVGGASQVVDDRANRLYVHQGVGADSIPIFEERAAEYGVADTGYSTFAAFVDYDKDRDLDLYVLNTATVQRRGRPARSRSRSAPAANRDRLYRNEGNGTFTKVTDSAGIGGEGYGLGLAISDVNEDGWPDIYTANDIYTRDRLYLNQGDGTFAERGRTYLRHQSYSAMGVDIADVNNDAHNDIFVLDMLPQDPHRRRMISNVGVRSEGIWQYGRNTLQLHNGHGPNGPLPFSEIGQLAGLEATGWSWAPLLADYDNDGDRDLFVSNGFGELVTHLDFAERRSQPPFSGRRADRRASLYEAMADLPKVDLPNRFFENLDPSDEAVPTRWQFAERTETWAPSRAGISNGAAFADLDRDGDLDLMTNNINREATLLENRASSREAAHALRVDLHGPEGNRAGLGAEITLTNGGETQYYDHSPYRGYQSTVEEGAHFGLGADSTADTLRVAWPDGTTQRYTDVAANQVLDVYYDSADTSPDTPPTSAPDSAADPFFRAASTPGLDAYHRGIEVRDFQMNPLLPHRYSQNGPGIAVGDVDGNGLDDVFVGGGPRQQRTLYRQVDPARFEGQPLSMARSHADMGALFFDADGDGDQDLYVVSGGNAGPPDNNRNTYQDRLYLNDGTGAFRRAKGALPDITASGSVVTAADYDRDGDLDLFVGGRVQARTYPLPPRSYVLRNDSDAEGVQFTDVTEEVAPPLVDPGLITDALWTDFNGDRRVDLIVVGEWMRIRFFRNDDGPFTEVTGDTGLPNTSGWWNSLTAGDFDRDGDTDYVAGNLGLNTRYDASSSQPVRIHAKDFDDNNTVDPIVSRYVQGMQVPAHGRRELTDKILGMMRRFPTHQDYAEATFGDLFTEEELSDAYTAEAVHFETSYLENRGDGTFRLRPLPMRAQTAPVFGVQTGDYTGDGVLDLLMVGNWYAPDRETGRTDASVGALLRGDGTGHFQAVDPATSGFVVTGDAKGLAEVATGESPPLVVATQNADSVRTLVSTRRSYRTIPLRPLDRSAELTFADGSVRRTELSYGSGYLSQSSRTLRVPPGVEHVTLHGAGSTSRTVAGPAAIGTSTP